jgi:hypothetical protein
MKSNRSMTTRKLYAQKLSLKHAVMLVLTQEFISEEKTSPSGSDRCFKRLRGKSPTHALLEQLSPFKKTNLEKTPQKTLTAYSLENLIDSQVTLDPKYLMSHLHQADRNSTLREQFIAQCTGMMTAPGIADLYHSKAKNRSQKAQDLKKHALIFGVLLHGKEFFPRFQFDIETGAVFAEMRTLIDVLRPDYDLNWQFAIWWITPNHWLKQNCPLLLWLAGQRDEVVVAAKKEMSAMAW